VVSVVVVVVVVVAMLVSLDRTRRKLLPVSRCFGRMHANPSNSGDFLRAAIRRTWASASGYALGFTASLIVH